MVDRIEENEGCVFIIGGDGKPTVECRTEQAQQQAYQAMQKHDITVRVVPTIEGNPLEEGLNEGELDDDWELDDDGLDDDEDQAEPEDLALGSVDLGDDDVRRTAMTGED